MLQTKHTLFSALRFDHSFLNELPGDLCDNTLPRQVTNACYSRVLPSRVPAPRLLAYSAEMAHILGLSESECQTSEFAEIMAGNRLVDGMLPYALCYGGHQFGHWAGQLGDGRAINLADVIDPQGARWTLQLKGAGLTPYSRSADGLAVLRSSLREFLCSEAMHHLGVPTTRALSLVTTGQSVIRDMFYNGNPQHEPGAIVCRVAPSFLRFGSLQIHAARNELDCLQRLLDFIIRTYFPELGAPSKASYLAWFEEVCRRTAEMIVHWQRVGFVHGVMNTDNMSILGLTIDYGPYGWLEHYDPDWTPNTTDAGQRRYRFGQQPQIAFWNLLQLANALFPLLKSSLALQNALQVYAQHFEQGWQNMMANKLGLETYRADKDDDLIHDLQQMMYACEADMTLFYRGLADIDTATASEQWLDWLATVCYQTLAEAQQRQSLDWLARYQQRLREDAQRSDQRRQRMNAVNPLYVLRNYLAQQAIDGLEQGDDSELKALQSVLRQPYQEQVGAQRFAQKRPDWARHRAGCSMLSCSS